MGLFCVPDQSLSVNIGTLHNLHGPVFVLCTFRLFGYHIYFFPFMVTPAACGNSQGWGLNGSCSCQLTPWLWQHEIQVASLTYSAAFGDTGSLIHWTRPGIEPCSTEDSQILCQVLNPLNPNGNFWRSFFFFFFFNSHTYGMWGLPG